MAKADTVYGRKNNNNEQILWQHEYLQKNICTAASWKTSLYHPIFVHSCEGAIPNPDLENAINNFMETDDPLIHNGDNIICETMSCISLYATLVRQFPKKNFL